MTELTTIERMFDGNGIITCQWNGQQAFWIAKQVGRALRYADDGESLTSLIRQKWKDEFIMNYHHQG